VIQKTIDKVLKKLSHSLTLLNQFWIKTSSSTWSDRI